MSDLRHLPVGTRVRVGFALIYEKVPGGMWRSRRLKAVHNWITDEQLVELLVKQRKGAEEVRARAESQEKNAASPPVRDEHVMPKLGLRIARNLTA